ncbi:MAG: cupin domain-containing protein [Chitinophagaceae bacterium]|nr:MAG: cupin domain-containing protein [Chitinophagaceae bacterium]
MAATSAHSWIQHLQMTRHVEGGWYSEMYRSSLSLPASAISPGFTGDRSTCTHIYFLLEKENFSAFHRIRSDEIWHFYSGDPITVYEIDSSGELIEHILGNDPSSDHALCCVVKAGNWFASRVKPGGEYGLVGCTVAPGFDFADFELAKKDVLQKEFPQHKDLIGSLCRE